MYSDFLTESFATKTQFLLISLGRLDITFELDCGYHLYAFYGNIN